MKKKHLKVIRDIQKRVPEDLLRALIKKEPQFAALKETVTRALLEPETIVSPQEKEKYQALLDSGYLDKEVDVVDSDIEKLVDAFYAGEIAKAIEAGLLPKEPEKLKLSNNKGKQYERRQAERLRRTFSSVSESTPEDDPLGPGSGGPLKADDSLLQERAGSGGRQAEEGESGPQNSRTPG